jgi:hypothetical protein
MQIMDTNSKETTAEKNRRYEEQWTPLNWRAWGSWFSWGSPIGLTLGYAIVMLSTGGFLWLLAMGWLWRSTLSS